MLKKWSKIKELFIQKLNSIFLKTYEILKKHQKCVLNIVLSVFFIAVGWFGYLLFMHPVCIEEVGTHFMSIQKVTGILEHVDIQQTYDNKESSFILRFFPKIPFSEDLKLSLCFPSGTLSSVRSEDIKFTSPDKFSNISLTIPASKTKHIYAIEFSSPVMKHISNDYLQFPISVVFFKDVKKFPVKYFFFKPSLTTYSNPVEYVPDQKSTIMDQWNDVVVARPNDASKIEPIRLSITNPVIVDRAERRRTLGTIIISLAASFIANILYELKKYVTKIK
jgi:hypothetical protein